MQTLLISTCSPLLEFRDIPIFYFTKSEARYISLNMLLKITGIDTVKGRQQFVEKPPAKSGIPLHITSVVNVEHVSLFLYKQKGWTEESICAAQRQLAETLDYSFEQYMKTEAFREQLKTCMARAITNSLPTWEAKLRPLVQAKLVKELSLDSPSKKHVLDDVEDDPYDRLPFKKKMLFDPFEFKQDEDETNVFAIDFTVPEIKEMLFL